MWIPIDSINTYQYYRCLQSYQESHGLLYISNFPTYFPTSMSSKTSVQREAKRMSHRSHLLCTGCHHPEAPEPRISQSWHHLVSPMTMPMPLMMLCLFIKNQLVSSCIKLCSNVLPVSGHADVNLHIPRPKNQRAVSTSKIHSSYHWAKLFGGFKRGDMDLSIGSTDWMIF